MLFRSVLPGPAKVSVGRALIDADVVLYEHPQIAADVQFAQSRFKQLDIDAMRAQGATAAERYAQFGHSAGGQLVHRMLSFGYRDRVSVAVSANAGTYAMPTFDVPWPFGLGEVGLSDDDLRDVLRFPIVVMAGTEDTKTTGKFFPKGPRSMRQGPHRHARAHSYVAMGREAAARLMTRKRLGLDEFGQQKAHRVHAQISRNIAYACATVSIPAIFCQVFCLQCKAATHKRLRTKQLNCWVVVQGQHRQG